MKIVLCVLALLGAASAAPNAIPEANPSLEKRCTAGTELFAWCNAACGYNCRAQYNSCRNQPPPYGCGEAYGRMLSYCQSCCSYGDCRSCQNCGNSYPIPQPA